MIKTEFSKVSELFLAYPYGFLDTTPNLVVFFEKLIGIIPDEFLQFIIVNNEEAEKRIKELYPKKKIEIVFIDGFHEIWLRDIMGFNTSFNKILKPIYNPDYCHYTYSACYLKTLDHQVKQIVDKSIKAEICDIPIILDGGNLVHNGKIGFITDKVIKQNQNIPNIQQYLKDYLGIKPIIIGSNTNDKLSHADGYMAFLKENQICLSNYPKIAFLKEDLEYLDVLNQVVNSLAIDKIDIFDRPVDEKVYGGGQTLEDKSKECLSSARGTYINFLILNDTIILPEYTIPAYKKTMDYNSINKFTLQNLGYKVKTINCDELAKLGGALHCISFTN